MNDLYLKLANSQYTQPLFQALNLPQPVELKRNNNEALGECQGSQLIASTKGGFAFTALLKSFNLDTCSVYVARSTQATYKLATVPTNFQASIKEIQVENLDSQKFNGLVFDATGIKTTEDLKSLYVVISKSIKQIRKNGRVIVISQNEQQISNSGNASVQGGLIGFVKSLAKETGKKGITCNLLSIEKGAQKYISTSIRFFLSSKSSYITGQSVTVDNKTNKLKKLDWQQPLKHKTALVTGAAQGIGRETAKTLARDGATVICLDIPANEALTKNLANEIGGHCLSVDLSDSKAAAKIRETISSQLGLIDIVVHNAGITRDKTIAKMPEHFWNQVIDINLGKVIEINDALLSNNYIAPGGRIICISSISGIAGNFGQTNYALSKSGIASYTKSLSHYLANERSDNITINAIAPGFIETQMTQKIPFMTREFGRRLNSLSQGGLPSDIAEGVGYFCHPASQSLNGNLLRICGQSLLGK